jgi:geranylgeranyl pyrophosphate synthase
MDDDDLRRGRPTLHRAFDEAAAVLAGDSLSVLAFEVVARGMADQPERALAVIAELARSTGPVGMIGGQSIDIASENIDLSLEQLTTLHAKKTGALLAASCAMGGLCAGASDAVVASLRTFGGHLGLAFQIVDDLLDVTADTHTLGKEAAKDATAGKNTFPKLVGIAGSKRMAAEALAEARTCLNASLDARGLLALAEFVVQRDR